MPPSPPAAPDAADRGPAASLGADEAATPPAGPGPRPATAASAAASPARRPALIGLSVVLLLAAIAAAAWWVLLARHIETTDNAYVHAPVVLITPQIAGTVVAVLADDTDAVAAGEPLVRLDPADARLAIERAEAELARAVREVRQLHANDTALASAVRVREAELGRAEAELARAVDDLQRRQPLAAAGAVALEDVQHAQAAVESARGAAAAARSALAVARDQLAASRALTDGAPPERHPAVQRAAAAVREAWLMLRRTVVPAPVAGQVVRRQVQLGQRVAPGAALMSLVPLEQAWVEANFKESQLRRMRVGQPVTLRADLYGGRVTYRGRVAGFGAGTGAAFALLPAQNATGNWIKVVQRVPVRIDIDAGQLAEHPLRVGLSMHAEVDVSAAGDAARPAGAATARAGHRAEAAGGADAEADARIRQLIASPGLLPAPAAIPSAPAATPSAPAAIPTAPAASPTAPAARAR